MSKQQRSQHVEQNLLAFLKKQKKNISPLLILTHDFPDPDALASAFALHFLTNRVFHIRFADRRISVSTCSAICICGQSGVTT